ncbi:MAG TPA: hypothetical protein VK911_15380, partial [Vicinamibacterales bacterium]|nr:hypothetical protein [Vicinamibacterales bacterium]
MNTRTASVALAVVALLGRGGQAQQPSFRAATELIVVDVSVVGKDGAPVVGLQEPDFVVKIDGQPRRVRSLKYIDESVPPGSGAATRPSRVSSNASESTGRLARILVDEGSIG